MKKRKNSGMGSHESALMKSDEWLTPPEILRVLGEFDLDPCAPVYRPWATAKHHYTIDDNGLLQPWFGRVWMNPPYGGAMIHWLQKMARHANGIALTFARTDTEAFQRHVFPHVDSMLFIDGRLSFYTVAGTRAKLNAGAPSVLLSYGEQNADVLASCGIKGKHIPVNTVPVIIVGVSPNWRAVVSIALTRLNGSGKTDEIYDLVERIAPDKVSRNRHYKEKVRQILQLYFTRITKGHYATAETNLA